MESEDKVCIGVMILVIGIIMGIVGYSYLNWFSIIFGSILSIASLIIIFLGIVE